MRNFPMIMSIFQRGPVRIAAWSISALAFAGATIVGNIDRADARIDPGVHDIVVPGLTYLGNASCSGSECHSAEKATEQTGQMIGDELNIWSQYDPHAFAYETLQNDKSKQIAAKLSIEPTSDRCIGCHAINPKQEMRGEQFDLAAGVNCEACHGPAEKWKDPHAKAGWTKQQMETIGAKGLLDQYGLVATANLSIRAHTCVACHLQIDKDLIDAGHPPLEFEMYAYNYYTSKKEGKQWYVHFDNPTGVMIDAKLWATGQAAAHEAAAAQVRSWQAKGWDTASAESLANIYKVGLDIAEKHFGAREAAKLDTAAYTPAKAAAAASDLARAAGEAKDKLQRRIVGFGVTALGASVFDGKGQQVPQEFWDQYFTATSGEGGEAYQAALNKMAEIASKAAG